MQLAIAGRGEGGVATSSDAPDAESERARPVRTRRYGAETRRVRLVRGEGRGVSD